MRRGSQGAVVLGLLLVACPGRRRAPPPELHTSAEDAGDPAPPLRGRVVDGVYIDPVHGFRVPVPTGWSWMEGPATGGLQIQISDPSTGVQIEVWRFTGSDASPRPRGDCAWTFQDHGPYVGPGGLALRTVATCVPTLPESRRVFAWMVPGDGVVWQLEGHVPPAVLVRGTAAVRSLIEQFSLEL